MRARPPRHDDGSRRRTGYTSVVSDSGGDAATHLSAYTDRVCVAGVCSRGDPSLAAAAPRRRKPASRAHTLHTKPDIARVDATPAGLDQNFVYITNLSSPGSSLHARSLDEDRSLPSIALLPRCSHHGNADRPRVHTRTHTHTSQYIPSYTQIRRGTRFRGRNARISHRSTHTRAFPHLSPPFRSLDAPYPQTFESVCS